MNLIAKLLYLIFLFHGQFGLVLRAIIQKLEGKGGDRQVRKLVTTGAQLPACLCLPVAGFEWGLREVGFWSCCGHGPSCLLGSIHLDDLPSRFINGPV